MIRNPDVLAAGPGEAAQGYRGRAAEGTGPEAAAAQGVQPSPRPCHCMSMVLLLHKDEFHV